MSSTISMPACRHWIWTWNWQPTGAFTGSFDWLYPLRVLLVGLVIAIFTRTRLDLVLDHLRQRHSGFRHVDGPRTLAGVHIISRRGRFGSRTFPADSRVGRSLARVPC